MATLGQPSILAGTQSLVEGRHASLGQRASALAFAQPKAHHGGKRSKGSRTKFYSELGLSKVRLSQARLVLDHGCASRSD
jgi:hypothetical protein